MKDKRFKITLRVKPYVGQYLLNNFSDERNSGGNVVNLRKDAELNNVLKNILCKKSQRYDQRYQNPRSRYSRAIHVVISQDDFQRYGWEISPTDAVQFGRIIERRAKYELYSYIDIYRSIGCSLQDAILRAQEKYNYCEEVWPADSIRRDYSRRNLTDRDFADTLYSQLDKIFVGKLSRK